MKLCRRASRITTHLRADVRERSRCRPRSSFILGLIPLVLAAGCTATLHPREGSESGRVRWAYFATDRPRWGGTEADLPRAVKEIDLDTTSAAYFVSTFNNPRRPMEFNVILTGPENERTTATWRQTVEPGWTFVGYQYELPLYFMQRNPGVWTLELVVDGERAGRYSVAAGGTAELARLRRSLAPVTEARAPAPVESARPVSLDGPRAERPTYSLGDRWIRSDGIWEVVRIEPDAYVFSGGQSEEIHLSKDLTLARHRYVDITSLEFTPTPTLDWPLVVGKQGVVVGRFRPSYRDPYDATLQWSIDAYEDVVVPAGVFKAFRITYGITPRRGLVSKKFQFWYAPEVRRLVKADSEWWPIRFELVAVDPADSEPLRIQIREPSDQAHLTAESEFLAVGSKAPLLTGRVTSGQGIAMLTVSVNGETVQSERAKAPPKKAVVLNVELPLRDGKNVVLVTATDAAGTAIQEARTVFYTAPVALTWSGPGPTIRVAREFVTLAVPVPPAPTDAIVTIALNDVHRESMRVDPDRDQVLTAKLHLADGENQVRVRYGAFGPGERIEERALVVDRSLAESQKATEPAPPVVVGETAMSVPPPAVASPVPQPHLPSSPVAPAIAEPPPLLITLSAPRDQERVEHGTIGLAGLVAGGQGIARVVVTLNGDEISRREERAPERAVALTMPVRLREGQNILVVTATEVNGTIAQDVRTLFYEKVVPLSVVFRYPHDAARMTEATTVAAAVITSSRGVAKVRVSLNGADVYEQVERSPQKSVLVTTPLTLREGVNTIGIIASEPDGGVRHEVRTVTYESPKVAEPPSPPSRPPVVTRERWAVVIGIGDYESRHIPRLQYAVADAEAVYQTLIQVAGFKRERVLLLTDTTERRPTLRNIRWALGTFLARSSRKDDTVLIFFAGHGAPEIDPRGVERDGLAKYLIPGDADPDDLYSSALPMDELQTIFGRIEAERVVAFLDTCYSGAAGGRTFVSPRVRPRDIGLDDQFLDRLTRAKGRAIITASRPAEVSIEAKELGHGVFTYYLVQGLKGSADLNRDGVITVQELYEYLEQQVTEKSRAFGGNQHPVMKGELEGVVPLVKIGAH